IPATYFIVREKVAHWADVCLALGVPVGLLGGTVGATGMALNLASPDIVFPATAIMLLTVLYGGLISAIGYFAQRQARSPSQASLSNGLFAIALIPFLGIIGWCMNAAAGIGAFFTPATLFVFYGVFAATFYFLKKVSSQDLVNAALFSSMLCLVAGLIQWYQSDGTDRSAIAFAMNGLNCGLLIYIVVYLWSLRSRTESIEAGKANWHWMEVSAFLVFMLFAPETIRETLINQQDEEAALIENAELENRLVLLEKRLALLEGS
ncbi:MAG: hypothetical protein CMQ29_14125, partial [Gammaproteobacteria bacterium]|nr:hypothetical protein [Gammaproteobacteria bacterium]